MLLLKVSVRPWKLTPLSQGFCSVAVGVLLILTAFLYSLQEGLKPVLNHLKHEQVITAYLDSSVDSKEQARLISSIRASLDSRLITEIKLVEPAQFVANLKQKYPTLSKELEDLGPEMNGVVPRYLTISGLLPDSALETVRGLPGIESAESSRERYRQILGAFSVLRWVARVMAFGICLALLSGLIHLSRLNGALHREAVSLIRLWGGNSWMVRVPSLFSGLTVGIAGGLLAFGGWMSGGAWLMTRVRSLSPLLHELPAATWSGAVVLLFLGMGIGLVAGIFGNTLASQPGSSASGGR